MALKKRTKNIIGIVAILSFLVLWTILIYNYPPSKIVEIIGIENGYAVSFFAALLGGTSVLFPLPYHLIVFTLGAGGLNPFFLGILAGTGVMLGDSTSYLLGYAGREVVPGRIVSIFNKLHLWAMKKPKWTMPLFLFAYGAFVPVPNDVVVIPLGIARYPYLKTVLPLTFGNIIFSIVIAFAGLYGWEWIVSLI